MASLSFLGVLAWSFLLAPLVVGLFALLDMGRFRREASEGSRASLAWFMVAVAGGLAYHTAVIAAFAAFGFVKQMHGGGLTLQGGLLYLESVLSCLALAALRRSGSHLRVAAQPAPVAVPGQESA